MTTFNVFDVERDRINLGPRFGEFELGELHENRHKRLIEMFGKLGELDTKDENIKASDLAKILGDLLEIVCIGADGLSDKLVDATDFEKHGEDAIGIRSMTRIVEFVSEWAGMQADLGNG